MLSPLMIILLYSRLRQMTTPASVTNLYLTTKARPECGTPLISTLHPCNIQNFQTPANKYTIIQHGALELTT